NFARPRPRRSATAAPGEARAEAGRAPPAALLRQPAPPRRPPAKLRPERRSGAGTGPGPRAALPSSLLPPPAGRGRAAVRGCCSSSSSVWRPARLLSAPPGGETTSPPPPAACPREETAGSRSRGERRRFPAPRTPAGQAG
ncbi:synapsin-1-like, partial [Camarhynchus parvulus]|uniref:synapsin-1-like n=1 Tax=Geospiza parvula TaxID=87175 RepID=UPI001237DB9F